MVRDHSTASQAGLAVVWAPCWTRWPGWTCSMLKFCCGHNYLWIVFTHFWIFLNCSSLIFILCLSPQKLQAVLDKCLNLHQRTTSGTAWKYSFLTEVFSSSLFFLLILYFATTGLRVSYALCFLNLQSKSYNLPDDVRKPTVGTTNLSADKPVSTLFLKTERGTVVLQHVAVVYGGFGRHCSAQRWLLFRRLALVKLDNTGLFQSVEFCIIPKCCLLWSFRNEISWTGPNFTGRNRKWIIRVNWGILFRLDGFSFKTLKKKKKCVIKWNFHWPVSIVQRNNVCRKKKGDIT